MKTDVHILPREYCYCSDISPLLLVVTRTNQAALLYILEDKGSYKQNILCQRYVINSNMKYYVFILRCHFKKSDMSGRLNHHLWGHLLNRIWYYILLRRCPWRWWFNHPNMSDFVNWYLKINKQYFVLELVTYFWHHIPTRNGKF
jgi:hypothetical protein